MKNNWTATLTRKLSSRKFWAAGIGFVTAILAAFNVPEMTVEQVSSVIAGVGALAVYMLSEAKVDAARNTTGEEGGGQNGSEAG